MNIAQKLRAEGIAQGITEGEARGEARGATRGAWLGKLQLLEELMGVTPAPAQELDALTITELEQRFLARQAEYNARFKAGR